MDQKHEGTDGVSRIWNDFLSSTSAHSISQVPLATSQRKRIYWYALFMGVLVVASYQSALLVIDYLTFPVLMNIRYVGGLGDTTSRRKRRSTAEACIDDHEYGISWEKLHPENKKRYLEKFGKEFAEIRKTMPNHSENEVLGELHGRLIEPLKKRIKRDHVIEVDENESEWIDYSKVKGENDWWGLLNATTADNFALIGNLVRASVNETKHLGHQPEDFIVQCSFDNSRCSYRDFRMFQHKKYGNCFTFNHGTRGDHLRYTSRSGSTYGLKLTLFIDQEEYIGLLTPEAGVRTTVHRPYTIPFPEDDGLDCRPGTATTLGIRQHQIYRTHYPYGGEDCVDEPEGKDAPIYNGDYSTLSCTKSCIQHQLLKVCQCLDDINTVLKDEKICDIMIEREANCVNSVYRMFEKDELKCNCNQLCNETFYTTQYSAALWPSDQHEGYLYADIASKSSKVASVLQEAHKTVKNVVRINVIYMELNKEVLTEVEKYGIWDLLSSLGGSMGLYVGMSLISFIELFEVTFAIISHLGVKVLRRERRSITQVLPSETDTEIYENIDVGSNFLRLRAKQVNASDVSLNDGNGSKEPKSAHLMDMTIYGSPNFTHNNQGSKA